MAEPKLFLASLLGKAPRTYCGDSTSWRMTSLVKASERPEHARSLSEARMIGTGLRYGSAPSQLSNDDTTTASQGHRREPYV